MQYQLDRKEKRYYILLNVMQTFIINILIIVIAETARKSRIFIILHLNGGSLVKN